MRKSEGSVVRKANRYEAPLVATSLERGASSSPISTKQREDVLWPINLRVR